jgi:hypothetical protein
LTDSFFIEVRGRRINQPIAGAQRVVDAALTLASLAHLENAKPQ